MIEFSKLQATGNDFIVLDASSVERDWLSLAKTICDRRFGIGGDGLILLLPSTAAQFRMRIVNSDGSEAETCGNGLRCFARYVIDRGLADGRRDISIETLAGVKVVSARPDGRFRVNMGRPVFHPDEIPVKVTAAGIPVIDYPLEIGDNAVLLTFISMGNPHAVCFVEDVAGFPLGEIGPIVEHHPLFPSRVNFGVAAVSSRSEITARIWERGAGETLSCGSGACAVAVSARLHDYIDNEVEVTVPGGRLLLEWDGENEVYLSGEARQVFAGVWPD